ncbi:MAG: hypothetical protein EZS28_050844, partial [Streblomastix strix]
TRPITEAHFNADSDLLFASSSDSKVSKWWSMSSTPAGVFEGHAKSNFII